MQGTNKLEHLQLAPPDPILGTAIAFKNDTHPQKMNLGVGAYRTDEGLPYVFQSVREAERRILEDPTVNKEYLPIDGLDSFNRLARELILGVDSPAIAENRVVTVQTISGTGSLRVGAEFLRTHFHAPCVYVSRPTWGNHFDIFRRAGFSEVREYPYYKEQTRGLDFEGMVQALSEAPANSIVLLHACAHNPTGVDLTPEQWEQIANLIQEKDLFPYFDSAYQGFATGDLENDAAAIRMFVRRGFQMLISQSFAKNCGLYGERIGGLHIVCANSDTAAKALSQLKLIIRAMYSNPPLHGALIVSRILSDPALKESWKNELRDVSHRIISMRERLREELHKLGVPGDWSHITNQIGMFSYTGLTTPQCENMINKWHIHMLKNGRISMAGINSHNVEYLARAIQDSVSQ
jgi:aspartate/tyrosine/aromatic aminotransferase